MTPADCKEIETGQDDPPLILVVEDDPDLRMILVSKLSGDYAVIEAENGKEGMDKAIESIPDLIITDVMMPLMDGLELCREIKARVDTSHIPVIMLTAKTMLDSQIEGLETGADDYVTKPFSMKLLKIRIGNLLETRRLLRERFSRDFKVPNDPKTGSSLDQDFLKRAFDLLEDHFSEHDFTAELFAENMNMSLSSLHRKLKALIGDTPAKLIWNARLKKAAGLLKKTDLRVTEIAFEVGFVESSHFSRQFRQLYGMTPSEFRESED
jgi:DNA-binding response OmpR family regulator